MRKFEFRFEAVGKVRKIEMEKQARKLAEAQLKVKAILAEIEGLHDEQRQEIVRLQKSLEQGDLPSQMMTLSDGYRAEIKRRLIRKRNELRDAENNVRNEREKLQDREKRRQVIEKIREKDWEFYVEERRKEETKQMDETSSLLWERNRSEH